jgi:DNA-binding CsgD family transcriptional regulator
VKYHVNKILVKLDVGSKHQAAAKAKALGLI